MNTTKIVIPAHSSPYVTPRSRAKSLQKSITSLQNLSEKFLAFTIVSFTIVLLYCSSFSYTGCKVSSFFRLIVIFNGYLYEILALVYEKTFTGLNPFVTWNFRHIEYEIKIWRFTCYEMTSCSKSFLFILFCPRLFVHLHDNRYILSVTADF